MTAESFHPYVGLPPAAYWKTAVAQADGGFASLWKPKFAIDRSTRIVTAGSCFAQHISAALRADGFTWVEAEAAPASMPAEKHAAHGYGIFSFRTGNIYTARLLRQWLEWACGATAMDGEIFEQDGRFYDPFRPSIPPEGFASAGELREARAATLEAMRKCIAGSDMLVFTLGLTEAWTSRSGVAYPMCPGTIRGVFKPGQHVFHNFTVAEVFEDLKQAFEAARSLNRGMRFLLTVSPVPLTATASGNHVMTATTYSKSVLRAVAGYLTDTRRDVDYFPSYEMIASPVSRGRFYADNMRSVTPEGVSFVMGNFFSTVASSPGVAAPRPQSDVPAPAAATRTDEICEDLVLETWSRERPDPESSPPNILLLGDSHMTMIGRTLDERGIRYAGGAILQASDWHYGRFNLLADYPYFEPMQPEALEAWKVACEDCISRFDARSRGELCILTNLGAHTSIPIVFGEFERYVQLFYKEVRTTVPHALIRSFWLNTRMPHLMLLRKLVDAGFKVVWLSDPPTNEGPLASIFAIFDDVLGNLMETAGCKAFNARSEAARLGPFPRSFISPEPDDWIHGSADYYRWLVDEVLRTQSIRPRLRQAVPA